MDIKRTKSGARNAGGRATKHNDGDQRGVNILAASTSGLSRTQLEKTFSLSASQIRRILKEAKAKHYIAVTSQEQVAACIAADNRRGITLKAGNAALLGLSNQVSRLKSIGPQTTLGEIFDAFSRFTKDEILDIHTFDIIRTVECFLGPIPFLSRAQRAKERKAAIKTFKQGSHKAPIFAHLASANSPILANLCPLVTTIDELVTKYSEDRDRAQNVGYELTKLSAAQLYLDIGSTHDGLRFHQPFHELLERLLWWREAYIGMDRTRIYREEKHKREACISAANPRQRTWPKRWSENVTALFRLAHKRFQNLH